MNMKRTMLFLACAAAAAFALTGCFLFPVVSGSGFLSSSTYPSLSGFTAVDASQSFNVNITQGPAYSVEIIADDNLVQYLTIGQNNGVLTVGLQFGYSYMNTHLTANIVMPDLSELKLSGACDAKVGSGLPYAAAMKISLSGSSDAEFQSVSCGALTLEVSGASGLSILSLSAGSVTANVSGSSDVTAAGSAGSESLQVSGASDVRLIDCAASSADVNVSGASDCWVNVSGGPIHGMVSGASTLYYYGSPSILDVSSSGASGIVRVY